jgi:hypothetical protein
MCAKQLQSKAMCIDKNSLWAAPGQFKCAVNYEKKQPSLAHFLVFFTGLAWSLLNGTDEASLLGWNFCNFS